LTKNILLDDLKVSGIGVSEMIRLKEQCKLHEKTLFSRNLKTYILLHLLLLLYSTGGIFSKHAAANPFLSTGFLLFYGIVLAELVIYAVGWQQILKRMPLSIAFANKSIVVIWAFIWGVIFFGEKITIGMMIGSVLVIIGILFVVSENE